MKQNSELELLKLVATCPVNDIAPRMDYVLVQIDKALWAEIQALRQYQHQT